MTRVNPSGTALSYSSYLGGSASDTGTGAAVDVFGNGYVVGYTQLDQLPHRQPGAGQQRGRHRRLRGQAVAAAGAAGVHARDRGHQHRGRRR